MKKQIYLLFLLFSISTFLQAKEKLDGNSQYLPYAPDGIPFVIADSAWRANLQGNHRAVVLVENPNVSAVEVCLPWRRADLRIESKKILVVNAKTGENIKNVFVRYISAEKAIIIFEPNASSSNYYIYYLPYKFRKQWDDARYGKPWNDYLPPIYDTDTNWEVSLSSNLPKAQVLRFESRTKFDFFTPMGSIATKEETDSILNQQPNNPIIFMEDRAFPIRLTEHLPVRWIQNGPSSSFEGTAMRNEYYVWQIGVWAALDSLHNVRLKFSDLYEERSHTKIEKGEITCFNQEGINWNGKPISFVIDIPKNKIQALWCGVQIPENILPGVYKGTISLTADELQDPRQMEITLNVLGKILKDKGDNDLWRHARLRWLNSQIGIDNKPVTPYTNLEVKGNQINATGKTIILLENGLPESITVNGESILTKELDFIVETNQGSVLFTASDLEIEQKDSGLVSWHASSQKNCINFDCSAEMEYDGYIHYHLQLKTNENITVNNILLSSNYSAASSKYFMGIGFDGGKRPTNYQWNWQGPWDSYWIGGAHSGLHVEFRGGSYHGPLLNDYKPLPPVSWANKGKGFLSVMDAPKGGATVVSNTGDMTLLKDSIYDFEFSLLITPVRPLDTKKQFSMRFYHADPKGFDKAAKDGANIANIHHAQNLNPVINYPFIVQEPLKAFIRYEHKQNRKVKIYYTIRELTNYVTEIYALKSLNHEIFVPGVGYGIPWLCEHLIDDYKPAWYTELPNETSDAALVLNGFSRWINYYLEGLRWMLENYELDGIYMDDVSFDRTVMKRMRKIMERYRPNSIIDLHSNTAYSRGPMNQYTDFFPYVDRLWFGESFKYNELTPDEWFVTFSGIPFGVMSEMLQDGGNRYLGALYGATARYFPISDIKSPVPVWKFWQSFGIEESTMIGYWESNNPIKTSLNSVKATIYRKEDKILIVIGNFDNTGQNVNLSIDWDSIGWNKNKVKAKVPYIQNFQSAQTIDLNKAMFIKPKKAIFMILENR